MVKADQVVMGEPVVIEDKMPKEVWRFVEQKLYHYKELKSFVGEWLQQRQDLLHRSRQFSEVAATSDGFDSSQAESKAIRMVMLEGKAEREAFFIRAVDDVMSFLSEPDRRLVQMRYIDNLFTNQGVARELAISEAEYYRRRWRIIERFAIRFGML